MEADVVDVEEGGLDSDQAWMMHVRQSAAEVEQTDDDHWRDRREEVDVEQSLVVNMRDSSESCLDGVDRFVVSVERRMDDVDPRTHPSEGRGLLAGILITALFLTIHRIA